MAFKLRSGNESAFKSLGSSPAKAEGEVVSKTSPGPGWTKTKGTNIWAPPVEKTTGTRRVNMKDPFENLTDEQKQAMVDAPVPPGPGDKEGEEYTGKFIAPKKEYTGKFIAPKVEG